MILISEQKKKDNNGKNGSIQALRAIAFIGVFLCHAGSTIHWSGLGVSLFFTLSGMLLFIRYYEREIDSSIKDCLIFAWDKIKKIYPLHILTMLTAILLLLINSHSSISSEFIKGIFPQAVCNIFLVQSWVPNAEFSIGLNGVAWYLSTALFLYFLFPKIYRTIRKMHLKVCISILFGYILISLIIGYYIMKAYGESSSVYIWYMYVFPLFRLSDFLAGCCLGKMILNTSFSKITRDKKFTFTFIELLSVLFVAAVLYAIKKYPSNNIAVKVFNNWSTPYLLLSCVLIPVFTLNLGYLTQILNNRFFRFIGDLSPYAFLIHYQVIFYSITSTAFIFPNIKLPSAIMILIEFVLSIFLSWIYYSISKRK